MAEDFNRILDECIDRINRGDSVQDCLSDHPSYAENLKPLLQSMSSLKVAYSFTPSVDAKRAARQKLQAALEQRRQMTRNSPFFEFIPRSVIWATIVVLVLVVVGVWGIRPALSPAEPTPVPDGNFAFLISDEVNDIVDFTSLNVTITRIGLQAAGDSGKWTEFNPVIGRVDLTRLQGEKSQEIWRGDIPAARYSQVFIYISDIKGTLKETRQTIEVKLPSSKLHLSVPFEITEGTVTSFTFDITVVATGNNEKYILKPQAGESGARQDPNLPEEVPGGVNGKGKK